MGPQKMTLSIRRVVTGHDAEGRAVFVSDDALSPRPIQSGDANFALIWTTAELPADNNDETDGALREAGLTLKGGSVIRIVDMKPGCASPLHRSFSIDYGIVLDGEIELELDGGETKRLKPGEVVVQRGTNHLWRNPLRETWARIAFVLIEAKPVAIRDRLLEEIHP